MNKQRQVYIFILNSVLTVLFCFSNALAQPENLSLLREANIGITNAANANPFQFHTSIRPYLQNEIQVLNAPSEKDTAMPSSKKMALRNYFSQAHALGIDAGKFFIKADPIFSAIAGYDVNAKDKLIQNSIGFRTQIQLGKKLFGSCSMSRNGL